MEFFLKLILNLILYFVIAIGENSDRMRNEALVLSSVYDAMRNNFVEDATVSSVHSSLQGGFRNNLNSLNYELRNKRNINDRWDVENGPREESYYTPAHQQPQFVKADR